MKKIFIIGLLLAATIVRATEEWHTLFAYNNVSQIAMSDDEVYALSDGSLFSVNKNTEKVSIYENLHSTGISCIYYDEQTQQLIVAYTNGKLDLLSSRGVQYIGDLYDKDMMQQKDIYNVTVNGYIAYFSTHYGIQTFDLRSNTLVDSYWIGDHGQEMKIEDILIANDSIYAFTTDSLFCAAMSDNLVDYRDWKREARTGRISPDTDKGKHYQDATDHWYAGGGEGIIRFTPTDRLTYKPLGPLNNTPYRLTTAGTRLYVVNGGRWDVQYNRPGNVMMYEDGTWTNISQSEIAAQLGIQEKYVTDFMNVAVDPRDNEHFWITSYGTGLYEFRENQAINKFVAAEDNTLGSAVASNPQQYTRLDFAQYDIDGNLWIVNSGTVPYRISVYDNNNEWHGVPLIVDNQAVRMPTAGGFLFDNRNANYKWIATARYSTQLFLLDDRNTPFDPSDDRAIGRNQWYSQSGQSILVDEIRSINQTRDGRIWLGTEQGIVIIDTIDYFTSDRCIRPELMDENGENPLESLRVMALCQDTGGRMWVGTETMGVYVLDNNATQILAHYTSDNTLMLSNYVMSLACDTRGIVYIGTAEGLLSFQEHNETHDTKDTDKEDQTLEYGTMQQWRLHYSYSDPQELVATPSHIYANASGALLSIDRRTEELKYWSKADGMSGSSIAHINYDANSKQLVIAYEDGRIDLLSDDEKITALPDLYMKASSVAPQVNAIYVGKRAVYLAMPFGIIAINAKKGEVIDTYYIGENASAVDVKQIVEQGDSIFAFSDTHIYSAALSDNLVDYAYWHAGAVTYTGLTHAVNYHDKLYVLIQNTLYAQTNGSWQQVVSLPLEWIHVSDGKMLAYIAGSGLYSISDEGELSGLTNNYVARDALFSQGEYWLTEDSGTKIVRLTNNGDDHFTMHCPNSNFAYFLHAAHNKIYSTIGGRWASQFLRYAKINIFDDNTWQSITNGQIGSQVGTSAIDPVSIAVDPKDADHYFVATYGTGVFEFRDNKAVKHYNSSNSTLRPTSTSDDPAYFTRTDGAMTDAAGNLWVMNATSIGQPLHVLTSNGQWKGIPLYSGGQAIRFTTPTGIHTDYRNANRMWMIEQRTDAGVVLFDNGGTPTLTSDDKSIKRTSWVDQQGRTIKPEFVLCLTQDLNNRIWIGTQAGIIIIPAATDFFSSNTCHRIIIPRNDGTGLGDYLLGNERINCMAVDGGNRMWIGTEYSGLYLIEDDTITVAHFTENNSLLPSNTIQSIAIQPTTGEVFVGTSKGLASYRSDASEASEDLNNAYAFPNPVRPNYGGVISIAGLMENTVVNIVDAGGNLVCKTKSHGGLAVWDGKLKDGRYATPGVYTALCNEPGGKHTVVKILVIR